MAIGDFLPDNLKDEPIFDISERILDRVVECYHDVNISFIKNMYNLEANSQQEAADLLGVPLEDLFDNCPTDLDFSKINPIFDPDYLIQLILNDGVEDIGLNLNEDEKKGFLYVSSALLNLKGTRKGMQYILTFLGLTAEVFHWYEVNVDPTAFKLGGALDPCTVLLKIRIGNQPLPDDGPDALDVKLLNLLQKFMWTCARFVFQFIKRIQDNVRMEEFLVLRKTLHICEPINWIDAGIGLKFPDYCERKFYQREGYEGAFNYNAWGDDVLLYGYSVLLGCFVEKCDLRFYDVDGSPYSFTYGEEPAGSGDYFYGENSGCPIITLMRDPDDPCTVPMPSIPPDDYAPDCLLFSTSFNMNEVCAHSVFGQEWFGDFTYGQNCGNRAVGNFYGYFEYGGNCHYAQWNYVIGDYVKFTTLEFDEFDVLQSTTERLHLQCI